MNSHLRLKSSWRNLCCGLLVTLVAGCGNAGRLPVSGRVTFPDGSPLTEGMVVCEGSDGKRAIMVRGDLDKDGRFTLGSERPGDGVAPGKYRVLVAARTLSDLERATMLPFIDPKFEKYETSGLQLEVKPGNNELNITVQKPAGTVQPEPKVDE